MPQLSNFKILNQNINEQIETMKNYLKNIKTICQNLQVSQHLSGSYQQRNYQQIKIQIKQKFKLLSINIQEILKIMEWKFIQIYKYLQKINYQRINTQQECIKKYQSVFIGLEKKIKDLQNKQKQNQQIIISLKNKNSKLLNQFTTLSEISAKTIKQLQLKTHKVQNNQCLQNRNRFKTSYRNDQSRNQSEKSQKSLKSNPKTNQSKSKSKLKKYIVESSCPEENSSYQPSYGSTSQKYKYTFGCVPASENKEKSLWKYLHNQKNNKICPDRQHRFQFLLSNLRDGQQSTQISQSLCSQEQYSVLSEAVVRRYQI